MAQTEAQKIFYEAINEFEEIDADKKQEEQKTVILKMELS